MMNGITFWDGFFYGYEQLESVAHYYKSKNVMFDMRGNTRECTSEEYSLIVKKYMTSLQKG